MVKRGESKSVHGRRASVSKHPVRGSASSAIVNDELKELRISSKVLDKQERQIEKGIRFIIGPGEFHVVTFVCSLIILAFLFASRSLVFYSVLTIAALMFAHFLKQHHRPHDLITILGLFFMPLVITMALFRDFLVWLLLAVYVWSAISTLLIYCHHKGAHAPLKVMWQTTYSKVVAITLALLVAAVLPLVLPDAFFSIFEMMFFYILPVAFVFFFFSKFLYIYFFDRVHIRHDLQRSLRHTITYTIVFIIALMCIYSLFAVSLYNSESAKYGSDLEGLLLLSANVEKGIMKMPSGVAELEVSKDLGRFAAGVSEEIAAGKSVLDSGQLSFSSILDDSYFEELSGHNLKKVRFMSIVAQASAVKSAIMLADEEMLAAVSENATFPGGNRDIDGYSAWLKSYVERDFVSYSEDPDVQDMLAGLNSPESSYSYFDGGGMFYWFAKDAGLDFVYHSGSLFGRQLSVVIRHLVVFREMAKLTINMEIFMNNEAVSSSAEEYLYESRASDTSALSSAIRYRLLKDSVDRRAERIASVESVSFKVE
jgi:hypothetical protein